MKKLLIYQASRVLKIFNGTLLAGVIFTLFSTNTSYSQCVDEYTAMTDSIGAGVDYIGQSFIANVITIDTVGVWLWPYTGPNQIKFGIAPDDGAGNPDETAVLWMSGLINLPVTGQWFYIGGLGIPVTPGIKYHVLIDTTGGGNYGVGYSTTDTTDTGENLKYSTDGGVSWSFFSSPMAIYISGYCPMQSCQSITTTFAGGNGSNGNMFDIVAINQVTITNFDGNLDLGTSTVEIWYRLGSFVGFETSSAGWTQIGTASVTSAGNGFPTAIPIAVNITIPAGNTVAFYVTSTIGVDYTDGTAVGNVYASDANLQVLEGNGGIYFNVTNFPRVFNGIIHYNTPLTTTFAGGNGSDGNMFDIVALNDVTITGFDAHPQASDTIEIYYRTGSYLGFQTTPVGWNFVGKAYVSANPFGTPTPVPILVNVPILAGDTVGFYVTTTQGFNLNYTDGTVQGAVFASDANIQFLEGHGGLYPFNLGNVPRIFNGIIYYDCSAPTLVDDVGVIAIDAPTSGCDLTAPELVTVRVKNFGPDPQSDIPVSFDDGTGTVTETIAGPLNPGDTITYNFTATSDLSVSGTYTFDAWTGLVGDANNLNDSITNYTVTNNIVISTFPYTEDFESGTLGAFYNADIIDSLLWVNTEIRGSDPGHSATHSAYFGNPADTSYNTGAVEGASLTLPCIDLSLLTNVQLIFNYFLETENLDPFDAAQVLISTDGIIFDNLADNQATIGNLLEGTGVWQNIVLDISAYAGNPTVYVRFSFNTIDGGFNDFEGFYIDDITIDGTSSIPDDVGVLAIDAPISGCGLTATDSVTVRVKNFGTDPQSAIPVSFDDGTGAVTETIAGPLNTGDTISYTFTATSNLSAPGTYFFDAWTGLVGDADNTNDSSFATVESVAIPAAPTANNASSCADDSILLSVTGTADGFFWYDSLTGGSLVAAGNTFYTPYLSTTTDYYVEGVNLGGLVNIGPVDNTIGTGVNYTTNDAYLIIDVLQPVVLKSARFYAAGAGNRIFEVRDASNNILGNVTVFVPDSESVVNIGLNLPVGNNLRLGLNSNSNTDLYRNDSGTAYPYTASGLMSITNTSAGTGYYYFFYDMTIATMSCQSARTQVTATINSCADVSVIAIDAPVSGCGLTVSESVTVRVKNLGSDTVSAVPVSYRINGGAPVIEVIIPTILPGDTSAYTFTTTADLSVTGTYIFDAWTNLAGDIDNANDSTTNYTVDNITSPTVNLGPDATDCDSIILDAGNPGATYFWSTGEITQTITATVSDTYFVEVTFPGCAPVYDTINVTVNLSPIVNLGSDTTVCIGILLDVTTGGATYNWSDASTNPTLSVSTSGTYWVDVTVGGCTTRDSIDVIVNSGPPVVNLGPDTTVCGGIVLDGGTNPGATFAWSTADTTQTIFVSISGTYSVDVTNACTSVFDTVTITVIPIPVVDLGNDTIICPGDTIILDATTAGVTYSWSTGDTTSTITVNTTGTYSVVLTDTVTWCTANDTIVVTVSSGATALFIFTTAGLSVTFTNTSLEASSYFWDYGDGIGTSTMTSETYIYATAGTYDVTLVATNPCGSDNITIPVTVTTGIAENNIATEQINVYPNPNEGVFTISFTGFENEKVHLTILDMQGRSIIEEQLTVNNELNKILDISSFSKGMYFLRVITSYNVLTRKVLVE